MPHIALLTDSRYVAATAAADDWYHANILHDDALLQQALLRHNVSCTRVDWADPAVDWSAFDLAVFRTTWDYYEKFEAFSAWLHRTEKLLPLCNLPKSSAGIWINIICGTFTMAVFRWCRFGLLKKEHHLTSGYCWRKPAGSRRLSNPVFPAVRDSPTGWMRAPVPLLPKR